jgi:hypothetical protein
MYGLARSCGLGFWESVAYSNAGGAITIEGKFKLIIPAAQALGYN